jgi:CubicO group peptidase (beta-lactamase class C family)
MKSRWISPGSAAAIVFGLTCGVFAQSPAPPRAAVASAARTHTVGTISAERLQRIGQLIDRRIAAKDISGAVTLVAQKGQIVHFDARGLMDIESQKPMAKDTLFDVASMTKPVTTVAVLMLAEEGRLRLTDPVSQFIPSFKNLKVKSAGDAEAVAATREITVRDLLTHTSGIVSELRLPRDQAETLARLIPTFATTPLEFQPGTRWKYSNTVGFDTLARIVEVASGQSFDRFLRERIFTPLDMKDTGHRLDDAKAPRLATNYEAASTGLRRRRLEEAPAYDAPGYFGGGWGLKTTAQDYLRFAQMLLNGGELDGKRLLAPRTVELMSSVHIPDTLPGRQPGEGWGLGVRVITDLGARNTWLSNGSYGWAGVFGTRFWVDPGKELVAILMVQTPAAALGPDFETAVMQAVVGQ